MLNVGLDLAGVENRTTGFCILVNMKEETSLVYKNEEILTKIRETKPRILAIDAPLSLPPGKKSIEERTNKHLRESDQELLKRGIKFFPVTLGPMRKLASRGINLKHMLEAENFVVVEAYPGGTQDILGIPRKRKGLKKLKAGLEKLGIEGLKHQMSEYELDAVTCAYMGKLFCERKAVTYGPPSEGIVMPREEKAFKSSLAEKEI